MNQQLSKSDVYYTIEKTKRTEIKVKGSRFIATAISVSTKEEAISFLENIRSEFHDATHNCFAYIIGSDGLEFRASDDGEPSGTAGKPILFAMKKYEFCNAITVVTRYFGGTKLGVGGLARAYSDSAMEVMKLCSRKTLYKTANLTVYCTYQDLSAIKKLVEEYAVAVDETYEDSISFRLEIPISMIEKFTGLVTSLTKGRAGTVREKK
jgi:uncharacterized YigZ family protein